MSINIISVVIWGEQVGAVARDDRLGSYVFEYDPNWVKKGIELAPLHLPLSKADSVFVFRDLPNSFRSLPGMLSDALPDDFGNALIDAWMQTRGMSKDSITTLDRLAYMGKRGMGALEFIPPLDVIQRNDPPIQMAGMVEAARRVLKGDFGGDAHAQAALANIIQVGTSAGGARAKAVIAWNRETQEIRSGQFDVSPGFEHWLLKFDGVGADMELGTTADYGRIEYAYHLMAMAAHIDMSPCRLLRENNRAHFMTKRFDRERNQKHHLTSLCAMGHLDYKQRATHAYEQLFQTMEKLGMGDDGLIQMFRRMTFNVMARNCDDHTKNFAFLLKKGGEWELAPAYDVTHAHNPKGEWTSQHLMSVNGRFNDIGEADLLKVADRFMIPLAPQILKDVKAAIGSWCEFAEKAELPAKEIDRVADDFRLVDRGVNLGPRFSI